MLVSGLDVRPQAAVFSQWHRVQSYSLSVCKLNGQHSMAVEKVTATMTPLLTPRHRRATGHAALCRMPTSHRTVLSV